MSEGPYIELLKGGLDVRRRFGSTLPVSLSIPIEEMDAVVQYMKANDIPEDAVVLKDLSEEQG